MFKKVLVASLMAFALAQAADDSCSNSTFTINSQSDLDALASCDTVTGNIVITTQLATATLNGVQEINGDLQILQDIALTVLSAPSLESISGTLKLVNLTLLNTVAMPALTSLGGIDFQTLPALQQVQFNSGVTSADDVLITDTQLNSLDGITLTTANTIDINNNIYLRNISMPQLTSVSDNINIAYNYASLYVNFPALLTAGNATFFSTGDVNTPKLNNVTGGLGYINGSMTSITARNLTSVGSLTFNDNTQLSNISMPNLATINGAFLIANNTDLLVIDGFPKVSEVAGAIDFTGDFTNLSLPSLSDVKGGMNVQSTSDEFECPFEEDSTNGVIKGDNYVCKGALKTVTTGLNGTNQTADGSGDGTSTSSGSSSSSTSTSGASKVASAMGVAALIAGAVAQFAL